jgi:hypothetical protein
MGIGMQGIASATVGTNYGGIFRNNAPNGAGVYATSDKASAAKFEITNPNNTARALDVEHDGKGIAGRFAATSVTNSSDALVAQHYGKGDAIYASALGSGNAGYFNLLVNHTNNSAVLATANGTGRAIKATSLAGEGVRAESAYGTAVVAETDDGIALHAKTSSGGTALAIEGNGAIRVKGAGANTGGPAFIHVCNDANMITDVGPWGPFDDETVINNPLCNGRSDAILIVTPRNMINTPDPWCVKYDGTAKKWKIYVDSLDEVGDHDSGDQWNVLVILP